MLDCIAVGKKIHDCRVEHHYSQDRIAELLYVSRQAVSRWETGQAMPTIDNMIELSRLFSVSFEELLCLKEKKEPDPENLFCGYDREFIVRRICTGEMEVDLPEVFWQFSPGERMQVLNSLKRRKRKVDRELYARLSGQEQAFVRDILEEDVMILYRTAKTGIMYQKDRRV